MKTDKASSLARQNRWLNFSLIQLILFGLWGFCFYRALVFYASAHAELTLTQTGAAMADFQFSQHILLSYAISFFIGTLLNWFMFQARLPSLRLPLLVICLTALFLIIRQPEETIVFFPSLAPYLALFINLCAGAVGGNVIVRQKQLAAR